MPAPLELVRDGDARTDVSETRARRERKEEHPGHRRIMMERVELAVEQRGSGPRRLLLLHGLGASRDHLYEVADALDGRFGSILPDLRGHGESPAGPVESIADYVEDLRPLVCAAAPVAICGLSFGGDLARLLWNAEPAVVAGVGIVDPMLDVDALWRWGWQSATTRREAYRRIIGPYLEHDFDRLVDLMADYPLTADLDQAARGRNARSHLRADSETIHATLRLFAQPAPLPSRPNGSAARVTVFRAARSPACPERQGALLAAELGASLVTLDCGHCASLSAPELLAEAIQDAFATGT